MKIKGICQGIIRLESGAYRYICQTHNAEGARFPTFDEAQVDLMQHQKEIYGSDMSVMISPNLLTIPWCYCYGLPVVNANCKRKTMMECPVLIVGTAPQGCN